MSKKRRTFCWEPDLKRLTITDPNARPKVTAYLVEPYSADFGEAFALVKLDAAGEPVGRYDANIDPQHEGCSCIAGLLEKKRCRHVAALLALKAMGRI